MARDQRELDLQVVLGMPTQLTKGWGAPEHERVYRRAQELREQLGDTPQRFPALFGLYHFYLI